jgi:FtsZ-interacting cell division protein ZipA
MQMEPSPDLLIPVVAIVMGVIMIIAVVALAVWHETRKKELQVHQDMRMREMEHQRKMKELEIDLEKSKVRQVSETVGR